MSDDLGRFLADASPASGVGFVPRARRQPIVVLVVDDSEDSELASLLAGGEGVAASDYDGSWSAQLDRSGLVIIKFLLASRDGGWERRWIYTDPGGSVLSAITAGVHHVAIVRLRGAIVVDAQAPEPIASPRDTATAPAPTG
jgi:hypothetical protein